MDYKGITFTAQLTETGILRIIATGEVPVPAFTQTDMDIVEDMLNDHVEVSTPDPLLTQRGTPLEVKPFMVAAAMRDLQAVEGGS